MNKKYVAILNISVLLFAGCSSPDPQTQTKPEKPVAQTQIEPDTPFLKSISALKKHINKTSQLNDDQLNKIKETIEKNISDVAKKPEMTASAISLVKAYEKEIGPLFINKATRKGFKRKPNTDLGLHRAMFALQQGLIDHVFTPEFLEKHEDILEGLAFKTSEYFPGPVKASPDPSLTYTVKINASQPKSWGVPVMDNETPARRPTGCSLAPGSIATVSVPESMVGKGYKIRVGAHSWDLKKRPMIKRLDRVSITYPINKVTTKIANPLGGNIYIEVPYKANAGVVDVKIKNVVRSPFFSARSFDKTTLKEWREVERKNPAPWADFESDRFMMQLPTEWIYNYDDPVTLMKDWDKALDCVSELFGFTKDRSKTVLYLQIDVTYRGNANFPGYPQSNFRYNPYKKENGKSQHWLLKGPQFKGETIFHELGHASHCTKFRGETEALVNLPYVAVLNKGFGVDLDTAFGKSFHNPNISLDQAAIMWMVTQNFRDGKPMDISNSPKNQVKYQHRGYGKYVEIANLFGWKVLENFWHSVNEDYEKGIKYNRNNDPTDNRILRLSKQAGVDLTPLIHFWGIQPDKPKKLKQQIAKKGLKPSAKIYDRLMHYKTIIPKSNDDFVKHAKTIYPKGIKKGKSPFYGVGWYYANMKKYNKSYGEAAEKALQKIIDTYFPNGRPKE